MNRPLFVLVIDSNPDHQLLFEYSLRASMARIEPVFRSSVQEALQYLEDCTSDQVLFPQLVLLDIHLPHLEAGWQLLKDLKTHYPRLPVLVLSADTDPACIKQVYELGANSFVAKPLNLSDWESHFKILLTYWLGVVTLPPL